VADNKLSGDQKKLVKNRLVQVYDSEGNELKYNTDYTFDMPVKDGEYMKITVKGKGNYEGSITASAKTCPGSVRNARLTVAEGQKKLVYNGSVQKADVRVEVPVVSGNSVVFVTLTEGKDYTLLYYKKGAGLINADADVIYPGTVYVRAAGLAGGDYGDESLVSKKTASYRITAK